MPLQSFVDKVGPIISAAWLNAVDLLKFTVFDDAVTKATARTALTTDAPLEVTNGGTGQRSLSNLVVDLTPYLYPPEDIRAHGADPTGATDSTAAIQACLDLGGAVYIPKGLYFISAALDLTGYGRLIYGDGAEISILFLNGTNDGFTSDDLYVRVTMRDFSIQGGPTSGRGIYFVQASPTEWTFDSSFSDLYIYTGKQAIYLPANFSCSFNNVHASSFTEHVFEVFGGPAVSFHNCYAHLVPAGKAGYRVYSGAAFYSCNGIDSPSNVGARWGFFGMAVSKGDAFNSQHYITFINCNFEDFNDYALQFRFTGNIYLTNCTFFAKAAGTYEAAMLVEYNNKGVNLANTTFGTKGATRNKLAYIYTESGCFVSSWQGNYDGVDQAGSLLNGGAIEYAYPEANEIATGVRNLQVTRRAYLDEALLTGVAGTADTDVIALGNGRQTTVGVAGGASALPGTPSGYIKIYIGPTQFVIPFYAQA